jgi:hypothetical protein
VAPPGCAIGFSGPTLDPGDAIRRARRNALEQLAASDLRTTTRLHSELFVDGSGDGHGGEFSYQDITGSVTKSPIVAIWAELSKDPRSTTNVRHVYAMSCRRGVEPAGMSKPGVPAWVLNVPEDDSRTCALGVGGPTRNPRDQAPAALRDGRRALGAALESRLHQIIIDTGRTNPRVASQLETTSWALSRVASAENLDREWRDDSGSGPLGLKQVLYGLVCIPPRPAS